MVGWLVIAACVGLLCGVGWFVGRVGREWTAAVEQCRAVLGGELTPGNLLLPPRLWRRTDDGLSLVIGLSSNGEGGRKIAARSLGTARAWVASTRLTVDGAGIPGDMRIRARGTMAERGAFEGRRVTTGITDFDRRIELEGGVSTVLSRLGVERRAAIAAAVGQGASLNHGVWVIERAEPIMRASELIGLARLLVAAAQATQAGGTIAEERLYASVTQDPEAAYRSACLDCLITRPGLWRRRAVEAALADPAPVIRLQAAQAAGVAGRDALLDLARSAEQEVRLGAIAALANDDGPEVRALLEELALSPQMPVRLAALAGIARLGHAPIELLMRFARHPDPALRVLALRGLRPAGSIAVEQALAALTDRAPNVVLAAVELLGARADARVLPQLEAVRIGPLDTALKAAVGRAVAAISNRPVPAALGGLTLAGPDRPAAGHLTLDDESRGRLSDGHDPGSGDAPPVVDLFAEPGEPSDPAGEAAPTPEPVAPGDVFDEPRRGAQTPGEVSPETETE